MTLSTALGFSAADLNANRLGVLTSYQRGMLSSQRSHSLSWPSIILLILLALGFALQIEWIFIAFCGACLVTFIIAIWQRFQEDFESPVEMVVGQWAQHTLPFGRYVAEVNGQTFNLPKHLVNAFTANVRYRLYYTSGTRTILSAEII